jgi:hypothetical protein
MLRTDEQAVTRRATGAGLGGIAFSVLTVAAIQVSNAPGGNYSASGIATYLSHGHRIPELIVFHLALLGLLGLIVLLAQLREAIGAAGNPRAAQVVWGAGVASVASFAIGWGIIGGQVVAHLEGGGAISVTPAVTYLLSEIGVVFIFGCGAILLGFALIVLMLNSGGVLPTWLRTLTLVCGIAGVAGLAFFTFFVLMLWGIAIGVWLVVAGRREPVGELVAQPSA